MVIGAFECPHCGFKNNSIQGAGAIAEMGSEMVCIIKCAQDLNRQIVKTEYAEVKFVELDFTIPMSTQQGILSTVEGILQRAIEGFWFLIVGLSQDQPLRLIQHPELHEQLEGVIAILNTYLDGKTEFTVLINDPSGGSYIENLLAPAPDPQMKQTFYRRTKEQSEILGLSEEAYEEELPLLQQVHVFEGNCSRCNYPSQTKMHMLDIPHFKEVIVMCTVCDSCGYKSNEVKSGGAIAEQGTKIILKMTDVSDLNRDILKSESCSLVIPEIELELSTGTLGGRFTTIEGLLVQVKEEITSKSSFAHGDSTTAASRANFQGFLDKLDRILNMQMEYTLILDDPLSNSHLQNLYAPDADPNMKIELYDRTYEQNEDFGLNDMVTEGYEMND